MTNRKEKLVRSLENRRSARRKDFDSNETKKFESENDELFSARTGKDDEDSILTHLRRTRHLNNCAADLQSPSVEPNKIRKKNFQLNPKTVDQRRFFIYLVLLTVLTVILYRSFLFIRPRARQTFSQRIFEQISMFFTW